MKQWQQEQAARLVEFFQLGPEARLTSPGSAEFGLSPQAAEQLEHFNIEWHLIPGADSIPLDEAYIERLYPKAAKDFDRPREYKLSYHAAIVAGHRRVQGRVVGVETTPKPKYLPGNRQFYGTQYGLDPTADPLTPYMGRAGLLNGTRYDHNYTSLREFLRVVNEDWRRLSLLPLGYRVTICPANPSE